MSRRPRRRAVGAVALAVALLVSGAAPDGSQQARPAPVAPVTRVPLVAGRSAVLQTPFRIVRISVADPAIADATVVRPREILVDGKLAGTVSLIVWGDSDRRHFEIVVEPTAGPLERQLQALFPSEDIRVSQGDELIILSGQVSSGSVAQRAVQLAEAFSAKTRVIDLLKQPDDSARRAAETADTISLVAGRSRVLSTPFNIVRIAVADPAIAAATVVQAREILVDGKSAGSVTLIVWGDFDRRQYEIEVEPGVGGLELQLRALFPGEDIRVTVSDEAIVLSGQVSALAVGQSVEQVATASSAKSKVINMLRTAGEPASQQVLLQVRFAEVDRRALTEFGTALAVRREKVDALSTTGQFPRPTIDDQANPGGLVISDYLNLFFFWKPEGLTAILKALKSRGYFHSLAEPNLIAFNGQEASFLAGGEFPVPVVQGTNNSVSVEYREFGVQLKFRPTIVGDLIRLKVQPEVSTIDFNNGVTLAGFRIPALSTRRADTEVELKDGQSFAIAGLMNNTAQETADGIPLLSSIPIIGHFFKSRSTQKEQTELLVIITPRLVRPLDGFAPPIPSPLLPVDPSLFLQPADPRDGRTGVPGKPGTTPPKKPGGGR